MVNDTDDTHYDDRIPAKFKMIEAAIRGGGFGKGVPLKERLEIVLDREFADIEDIQGTMLMDQIITENVLANLCEKTLAKRIFPGGFRKKFSLLTHCAPCAESGKKRNREKSRQYQELSVDRHVMQVEFLEADSGIFISRPEKDGTVYDYLTSQGFHFDCPTCRSPLEIISSSNVILPDVKDSAMRPELIYALISNVKSGARYYEKLVHDMFWPRFKELGYDAKKRRLIDKYRFVIIPNIPTRLSAAKYRNKFKNTFGVRIPRGKLEDQACYALLEVLKRNYGFGYTEMQDDIANPKLRRSQVTGRMDEHKMLQFPVKVSGKTFEGKINSYGTEMGARGRIKGYSHQTYVQREQEKRARLWSQVPETDLVHSILMNLFPHNPSYTKDVTKDVQNGKK